MFGILTFLFCVAIAFLFIYFPFLNHVAENEIGIAYPYLEFRHAEIGEIEIQECGSGWHCSDMMTCVSYISLDTFQTNLVTGETVQYWFKPQGLPEFLKLVPAERLPAGSWDFFGKNFRDHLRAFVADGSPRSFLGVDTINTYIGTSWPTLP